MKAVGVNAAGLAECAYCHEATGTVKSRRMPWDPEEDGQPLCRECWRDAQKASRG